MTVPSRKMIDDCNVPERPPFAGAYFGFAFQHLLVVVTQLNKVTLSFIPQIPATC